MAEFNASNINPGLPGRTADEGSGSSARLAAARRTTVEPRSNWYLRFKRGADLVAGAILLVLLSPCIAIGALLVKLTSRGPAFYRQVRVGLDGREFTLFKLRTMRQDAEAETGPVWSTEFDARVTPLGRLLRCSHIDEFPQLWNVLCGHMSLVGPRPERPEFVAKLEWEIPFYRERLNVRPGITGLAQLRLPPDTTLESVRLKVEHDVFYVRHVNPVLDLKLMLLTAWRLVREVNHFFWKCIRIPTDDDIERGFQRAVGLRNNEIGVARFPDTTTPLAGAESHPDIMQSVKPALNVPGADIVVH